MVLAKESFKQDVEPFFHLPRKPTGGVFIRIITDHMNQVNIALKQGVMRWDPPVRVEQNDLWRWCIHASNVELRRIDDGCAGTDGDALLQCTPIVGQCL